MRIPKLTRHAGRGLGRVKLDGKDVYLGKWPKNRKTPPPEVQEAYDRLIAEWLARGKRIEQPTGTTVAEVCLAFMEHARIH